MDLEQIIHPNSFVAQTTTQPKAVYDTGLHIWCPFLSLTFRFKARPTDPVFRNVAPVRICTHPYVSRLYKLCNSWLFNHQSRSFFIFGPKNFSFLTIVFEFLAWSLRTTPTNCPPFKQAKSMKTFDIYLMKSLANFKIFLLAGGALEGAWGAYIA